MSLERPWDPFSPNSFDSEGVPSGGGPQVAIDATDVVGGNVEEAFAYAESHPDQAEQILTAERRGKGRKTLIAQLEELLGR